MNSICKYFNVSENIKSGKPNKSKVNEKAFNLQSHTACGSLKRKAISLTLYDEKSSDSDQKPLMNNDNEASSIQKNDDTTYYVKDDRDSLVVAIDSVKNESIGKTNLFSQFAFGSKRIESNVPKVTGIQKCDSDKPITATKISNLENPSKSTKKCVSEFVAFKDLPHSKKLEVTTKWLSFVNPLTNDIEEKRFQIFVAARLHARCQDGQVRKAMNCLYEKICPFTVQTIATSNTELISSCLSNLQYHNVKSEQIVKAAQVIIASYGGVVPEDENDLKTLPGIGPVFADLLSSINTRETVRNHIQV